MVVSRQLKTGRPNTPVNPKTIHQQQSYRVSRVPLQNEQISETVTTAPECSALNFEADWSIQQDQLLHPLPHSDKLIRTKRPIGKTAILKDNHNIAQTRGMIQSYRVIRTPAQNEQISETETATSKCSESAGEAGQLIQQHSLDIYASDSVTKLGQNMFEDPQLGVLPHPNKLFGKKRKKNKKQTIQKPKVNRAIEHLAQLQSMRNKFYKSDSETPTKERLVESTCDKTETDGTYRKLFNDFYQSSAGFQNDSRSVLLNSSVLDADTKPLLDSNRDNHNHFKFSLQHED